MTFWEFVDKQLGRVQSDPGCAFLLFGLGVAAVFVLVILFEGGK